MIGAGFAATVWQVTENRTHRTYVAKVLDKQTMTDAQRARWTSLIAEQSHMPAPGLVPFLLLPRETGETESNFYQIIDYIPRSVTLERLVEHGTLTVDHALRIVSRVAMALHGLHSRGIIHGEVRPINIMASEDDFENVWLFGVDVQNVVSDPTVEIYGAPAYLPPELLPARRMGEDVRFVIRGQILPYIDIYALGVVLLEAITRRRDLVSDRTQDVLTERLIEHGKLNKWTAQPIARLLATMLSASSKSCRTAREVADTAAALAVEISRNQALSKLPERFDVALTFAGPDRPLAATLANVLRDNGLAVFYDQFYSHILWGMQLPDVLDDIYRKRSRYCVMLVSDSYAHREWTNYERQSVLARAVQEKGEAYLLPVKVDETDLPGLPPSVAYVSLSEHTIEDVGKMLLKRFRREPGGA